MIGYDLVADGPMRWLHRDHEGELRMVGIDELRVELARLPLADIAVRPGLGRVVMRFTARRNDSTSG